MKTTALFTIVILATAPWAALATVKLSTAGICHTENSPWYEKTKNFTIFSDLQACIAAGGRLPKGVKTLTSPKAAISHNQIQSPGSYRRSEFGEGWSDSDNDCQDSRAEVLIQTSTVTPRLSGCRVASGRWISPFTGQVILNAKDADIDHTVPLHWAWRHGAAQWSAAERERFANDPINLQPVEAELNRAKGAKGPDQWLPPSGQCQYVSRFKRIVLTYRLILTTSEQTWIDGFLQKCRQ